MSAVVNLIFKTTASYSAYMTITEDGAFFLQTTEAVDILSLYF